MKKEKSIRRFLSSKLFFLLGIVVLGFLLVALANKFLEGREISREMEISKQEIARLETKNSELSDLLGYLNTDDFLEQEARLKFNMQKPGESVMIVQETGRAEKNEEKPSVAASGGGEKTNPAKWWDYFFNHGSDLSI